MNDVDEETSDPRVRYQLVQKIGQGSYGSVYKAYDIVRAACVAVKMIDLEGMILSIYIVYRYVYIHTYIYLYTLTYIITYKFMYVYVYTYNICILHV
jgi:serine/threonine protein kinase